MITLHFTQSGDRRTYNNKDIILFSNVRHNLPENHELVVLENIETKQCAIVKQNNIYSLIDLCTFDTNLLYKNEVRPLKLNPMTYYQLRNSDRILIGNQEVIFLDQTIAQNNIKSSFYVPETQQIELEFQSENTTVIEHEEIPETQFLYSENEVVINDNPMQPSSIACKAIKNEFNLKTQPLWDAIPRLTRKQAIKLEEVKPKTVDLSVFDRSTLSYSEETEPIHLEKFTEKTPSNKRKKPDLKDHSTQKSDKNSPRIEQPNKKSKTLETKISISQQKKNSILISDDEESESEVFSTPKSVVRAVSVHETSQRVSQNLGKENRSTALNTKHDERVVDEKANIIPVSSDSTDSDFIPSRQHKIPKPLKYESSDDDSNSKPIKVDSKINMEKNNDTTIFEVDNDEFDIPSQVFDSQFLEKVNGVSEKDSKISLKSTDPIDIKNDKNEDNSTDSDLSPLLPKKKRKLFKFESSDDD